MDHNKQDVDFAQSMIEHHQSAIDMSLEQIDKGMNKEMINLAKNIIIAQSNEINDIKKWLKERNEKLTSQKMKM